MDSFLIVATVLVLGLAIAPFFLMRGQFGKSKGKAGKGGGAELTVAAGSGGKKAQPSDNEGGADGGASDGGGGGGE